MSETTVWGINFEGFKFREFSRIVADFRGFRGSYFREKVPAQVRP